MQNAGNEGVDVSGETHWVVLTLAQPVTVMQNLDSTLISAVTWQPCAQVAA